MKKQLVASIVAMLLLAVVVVGSTYAFFVTTLSSSNNVNVDTSIMNIAYTKGTPLNGTMQMVSNRNEGYITSINIRTTAESVTPTITLFLNIEEISNNIAVEGFVWEVCAARSGDQTVCRTGNFAGYNDTNNNVIALYPDYQLSTTNTTFTVYLWLDGSKLDDSIIGGSFSGYIGAQSEQFTARFN